MKYHYQIIYRAKIIILLLYLFFQQAVQAQGAENSQLRCANVFSDHMVLQRNQEVPVWGWAWPGQEVIVKFAEQERSTLSDPTGKWQVRFGPIPASSVGREMLIIAGDTIHISDILVGDLWLCSGQSNMEMNMRPGPDAVFNVEDEIATADYPTIRLLKIPPLISFQPREDINQSTWEVCSPQSVPSFSAAGYFFGRELINNIRIPIGLINASMGASTAEAWTGAEGLAKLPDFKELIDEWPEKIKQAEEEMRIYNKESAEWDALLDSYDAGYQQNKPVWAEAGLDDSAWHKINLPTHWEKAGFPDLDGFMWFRKMIELTEEWIGKDLTIGLGTINDMDRVWFNGVEVGRFEKTSGWTKPREYSIPACLVKTGWNVVAVRVYDGGNNGGICGSAKDMWLRIDENIGRDPISLNGEWLCKPGFDLRAIAPRPLPPDFSESNKRIPTGLYNGMIYPLAPFAIKGVIWYQGESNAGRAGQYHYLLPAMIENWRARWGQGDFPFGIVQLPNFLPRRELPSESSWAELREAQARTADCMRHVGLAVTIDIGEADYIHPRNKQDVGKRLALWALARVYDKQIEFSGPIFKSMKIEGNKIILRFNHADNGLITADDERLKGFSVAGGDSVFHWAWATIKNNQVVIWSEKVTDPLAVRYAWADNPACNLYNKAGLPAAPFRTDNWKKN